MKGYLRNNPFGSGASGTGSGMDQIRLQATSAHQKQQLKRMNASLKSGSQRRRTSTSRERLQKAKTPFQSQPETSNTIQRQSTEPALKQNRSLVQRQTNNSWLQDQSRSDLIPSGPATVQRNSFRLVAPTPNAPVSKTPTGEYTRKHLSTFMTSAQPCTTPQQASSTNPRSQKGAKIHKSNSFIAPGGVMGDPQLARNQNHRKQSLSKLAQEVQAAGRRRKSATPTRQAPLVNESQISDQDACFRVCVRIRPLLEKERMHVPTYRRQTNSIIQTFGPQNRQLLRVYDSDLMYDHLGVRDRQFAFHEVFGDQQSNVQVFSKTVKPLLAQIKQGYNATCFAYGMTGAGKTHTMFGSQQRSSKRGMTHPDGADLGIASLAVQELFAADSPRSVVTVNFLEIYNEQVKDLLCPVQREGQNLAILEDPSRGVVVQDLCEYEIEGADDLHKIVKIGNDRRTVAPTGANQTSSRSHAILIFNVVTESQKEDTSGSQSYQTFAKLQIVDLAGSERAQASDNRGQRMIEGANINKSLLALGNCINALSDTKKQANANNAYVGYRDSKLTRLLKDSLGGNTKTVMLACVSQFYASYEETLNTLKYAQRACQIKNSVTRNIIEHQPDNSEQERQERALFEQQRAMHAQEQQQSRAIIQQYDCVIKKLQGQVGFLQTELSRKHEETSITNTTQSAISQPLADLFNPNPVMTRAETPSEFQPIAPVPQPKSQVLLSSDEWPIYEYVKAQVDCLNDSGEPSLEQRGLQDFFTNVHEKVIQNVTEKHLLLQQDAQLREALDKSERQVVANQQFVASVQSGSTQIDEKLIQMKQNEYSLLTQSLQTNKHLLAQIKQASQINEAQYGQLKSYMTSNLPDVLCRVIVKLIDDQTVLGNAPLGEELARQLSLSQTQNAEQANQINQMQRRIAELEAYAQQVRSQPPVEKAMPQVEAQLASSHQQVASGAQQSRTKSRSISQSRSQKLGRYLSRDKLPTQAQVTTDETQNNSLIQQTIHTVSEPSLIVLGQAQEQKATNLRTERSTEDLSPQVSAQQNMQPMKRQDSRSKYIQAATPVSRVSLGPPGRDTSREPSGSRQERGKNLPPPIKEFKRYAQVRQESKQRLADSQRSLEKKRSGTPESEAIIVNTLALFQSRNDSTNEQLQSIEQELQRHKEVDSQRKQAAQKNQLYFNSNHNPMSSQYTSKQNLVTQESALLIRNEASVETNIPSVRSNRQGYHTAAQATAQKDKQAIDSTALELQDSDDLQATQKKQRVVKHLKLNSLTTTKPEVSRRGADFSEDELTQMSCGMNIRDTFRELDSSSLITAAKQGPFNATQGVQNELLHSYLSLQKGQSELSASKRVRGQLQALGLDQSQEDVAFFTERGNMTGLVRKSMMPFDDKIHQGDEQVPLESNYELAATPQRDFRGPERRSLAASERQRIMRQIVQPSEPSEFSRLDGDQTIRNEQRTVKHQNYLQTSPQPSENMTCNLRSVNGSPKINQEAVQQILGQQPTTNDRHEKLRPQPQAQSLIRNRYGSPSETQRTDQASLIPIQIFPQTTQHMEGLNEIPDWSQVLDAESSHVQQAFTEEDLLSLQENDPHRSNSTKRQLQPAAVFEKTPTAAFYPQNDSIELLECNSQTERTVRVAHHAIRKGSMTRAENQRYL